MARPTRPIPTQAASSRARGTVRTTSTPAPAQELGQTQHSGPGGGVPVPQVSPLERANQALLARLDPNSPNYIGPGWERGPDSDGAVTLRRSSDPTKAQAQNQWELGAALPQPAIPTLDDLNAALNPAPAPAPLTLQQQLDRAAASGANFGIKPGDPGTIDPAALSAVSSRFQLSPQTQADLAARTSKLFSGFDLGGAAPASGTGAGGTLPGNPTSANPEAGGPAEVDRARIDALLGNVSRATSGLAGLANLDQEFSMARAQLAQGLDQGQRQNLALARSGNRRDAAALGARAIQSNAEMAAQTTQSAAMLRAQEEEANRRLKLDAFKAAGDLGLNAAALEVDVNRLNMGAATDYLNQLFETNRLGMQLDEAEAQRVTNFVRDMALVAKDYYALSLAERQSVRDDLTRRYGISEQTKLGLEQLDSQPGFWEQAALGLVSGAGQGGTAALTTFALSDARTKEEVADTTDEDLDDLLSSVRSQTYVYKGARSGMGRQLGLMAQDLKRSKLGRGMVDETTDGTLVVDGARAGLTALSAVSKVYDKLRALEGGL